MTNKEKAVALLYSFENKNSTPLSYINPERYIQHNLMAKDGLLGLVELLSQLPDGRARVKVFRALEDGEFVVTHTEYDFFGCKAGFDVFRFERGLMLEHWDNLQEIAPSNPSGHTQFDGATDIIDCDKTEANKDLVRSFFEEVFIGGNIKKIKHYFKGDNYIQHNPMMADKLSPLINTASEMAKADTPLQVDKIHLLLGEGNFVFVMSGGMFMGKHSSFADLFRIEKGKIAEHWDTIETIPPHDTWKNENGKF